LELKERAAPQDAKVWQAFRAHRAFRVVWVHRAFKV
jgi:hypothetical protein